MIALGMPTMDLTVHLSDLIIFGGGLFAFVKISVYYRDILKEIQNEIGSRDPRKGLLGDVADLKECSDEHHDWLVALRARDRTLRTRAEDEMPHRRVPGKVS